MAGTVYRFGPFCVDTSLHSLHREGTRISIQEQPFQVLLALLACPGQVVTREALRMRLWGTDTFVDFDQSLNSAMRRLRLALEDNSREPLYIETVPRIGFRFLPEVTTSVPAQAGLPDSEVQRMAPHEEITSQRLVRPLAADEDPRQLSPRVLGLGALALCVGLLLGGMPSRLLSLAARSPHQTPRDRSVHPGSEAPGLPGAYPGMFSLHQAGFASQPSGTEDMQELQGWYHLRQRSQVGYVLAQQEFGETLRQHPQAASALVGFGQTQILLALNGDQPRARVERARDAAREALHLAPNLATAHAVLGAADALADWNDAEATQEFQEALTLEPHDSLSHLWYAVFVLLPRQNYAEAEREAATAIQEDPLSLIAHTDLGWILSSEGKQSEALAQYRFVLQLDPTFVPAQFRLRQMTASQPAMAARRVRSAAIRAAVLSPTVDSSEIRVAALSADHASQVCTAAAQDQPTLSALRDAVEQRCPSAYFFAQNPELARLSRDPGFLALIQQAHPANNRR